jgi:hypothetical protein
MKILLIIFSFCFFCFFTSCSQPVQIQSQTQVQNKIVEPIETSNKNKTLEKLSKPSGNIRLPEIKKIGEYGLTRNSETKDEKGWMLPPYKYAEIKMGFENEPQIGEKITFVPLQTKVEPFQLQISKVTKTKNSGCAENKKEFFWAVEFERIIDKEILEVKPLKGFNEQMPFGVFIIYPSVEFARSLNKSSISKTTLPKNVSLKRVNSVIDLDNDGKPDLLSVNFCCGEPDKNSAENCPYLCQKYYRKTNGNWEVFDIQDISETC